MVAEIDLKSIPATQSLPVFAKTSFVFPYRRCENF